MVTSVNNVSNAGTLSSTGIGSGLDVTSIINKLMAVEQRPLTALQAKATGLNTKLSAAGQLQSLFSTLQTKSNALADPKLWNSTSATSSDSTAVGVSTSQGAAVGSYAVMVSQLAVGQTVTSTAQASSAATLSEGTLTIELGSYGSGSPASGFTAKSGSSAISISIGSGDTSLAALRDKINAAGAGVSASIITDASGARLSLRSSATGAENAFRITASETADDGDPATGLSALAYDASAASSAMTRTMTSADAQLTVNGVAISSASNTLSNVVEGLTLNLSKTTAVAVELTVASDKAAVKTGVTDFIAAFNAIAGFISTQTDYNAATKTGGPLQGDQSTLALQNQLRAVLNQGSTASSTWSRMSDIGITMQKDGTLAADNTKLDNALGNLPEMKKLLSTDGSTSADSGFVRRFKNLADAALNSGGLFATRTASIQTSLTSNSKSQDAMQKRLDATQARLQAQYSALDTQMATLNNLSTYMAQQITQYNKSTA